MKAFGAQPPGKHLAQHELGGRLAALAAGLVGVSANRPSVLTLELRLFVVASRCIPVAALAEAGSWLFRPPTGWKGVLAALYCRAFVVVLSFDKLAQLAHGSDTDVVGQTWLLGEVLPVRRGHSRAGFLGPKPICGPTVPRQRSAPRPGRRPQARLEGAAHDKRSSARQAISWPQVAVFSAGHRSGHRSFGAHSLSRTRAPAPCANAGPNSPALQGLLTICRRLHSWGAFPCPWLSA